MATVPVRRHLQCKKPYNSVVKHVQVINRSTGKLTESCAIFAAAPTTGATPKTFSPLERVLIFSEKSPLSTQARVYAICSRERGLN